MTHSQKATSTHVSLKTCQLLHENGCKVKAIYEYIQLPNEDGTIRYSLAYRVKTKDIHGKEFYVWREYKDFDGREHISDYEEDENYTDVPAYSWSEIIIENAKEFFGEDATCKNCKGCGSDAEYNELHEEWEQVQCQSCHAEGNYIMPIIKMLNQGKTAEAEKYFLEHNIFTK